MSQQINNNEQVINTIIVLRNDQSTNWESSDHVMLKGEVGISYLENGNVIAKLGDGEHTWKDLPQIEGVFEDEITLTHNFGRYKTSNGFVKTEDAKGKTTSQWLIHALSETKEPVITQPEFTLKAATTDSGKEIGDYIKSLSYECNTKYGEYEYGPADTGLSADNMTWVISNSVDAGQTITKEKAGTFTGKFTLAEDKYIQLTQETSKNYATITGTYSLDASKAKDPFNNVGATTTGKITDKTGSITKSVAATSYRKAFWGVKTPANPLDIEALTSTQIRGLGNSTTKKDVAPETLHVPAGSQQVIIALKAGLKNTLVAKDANSKSVVTFTKKASAVAVEGANAYKAIPYDIWYVDWNPDKVPTYTGIGSAKELEFEWFI